MEGASLPSRICTIEPPGSSTAPRGVTVARGHGVEQFLDGGDDSFFFGLRCRGKQRGRKQEHYQTLERHPYRITAPPRDSYLVLSFDLGGAVLRCRSRAVRSLLGPVLYLVSGFLGRFCSGLTGVLGGVPDTLAGVLRRVAGVFHVIARSLRKSGCKRENRGEAKCLEPTNHANYYAPPHPLLESPIMRLYTIFTTREHLPQEDLAILIPCGHQTCAQPQRKEIRNAGNREKYSHGQGRRPGVCLPLVVYGFSSGPPVNRTGNAADGGLNCSACHSTFGSANSGTGHVSVSTVSYIPGQKQSITVTVEDPDAQRWGFQITARYRSNENVEAGAFVPNPLIRVRCDPDGRNAPCGGGKEFVEQTAPYTQLGTRGSGKFTIEWIAPERDYGEVVFYAAGNAANGDGTNNGDHIYTTSNVIRAACNVTGTPSIMALLDPASLRAAVSPGGLLAIYGDGFLNTGNGYRAVSSDLVDGRLPTEFGCVQVTIGGRAAPIVSHTGGVINAQVPALTPAGNADVQVSVKSGDRTIQMDPVKAQVAPLAPAFFTMDGRHLVATAGEKAVTVDAPASRATR